MAAAGVLGSQRRRLNETRSSYLPPRCAAAPVAAAHPASPAERRGARRVSFARRCAKSWAGGGKAEPCFAARRSSWRFSLRAAWYASSCAFLSSALARCRARHACVLRSWRARRSSSSACDMPAVALGFFTAATGATRHVLRGRRMLLPCAAGREEALGDWLSRTTYDRERRLPSSLSAAVLPRLTPSLRAQLSACKQQLRGARPWSLTTSCLLQCNRCRRRRGPCTSCQLARRTCALLRVAVRRCPGTTPTRSASSCQADA